MYEEVGPLGWLSYECGTLINEISAPIRDPRDLLCTFCHVRTQWEHGHLWTTKSDSTLILDFPVSRTVKNKCLFKPPSVWQLVIAVQTDSDRLGSTSRPNLPKKSPGEVFRQRLLDSWTWTSCKWVPSNPEFMVLGNTVSLENMVCLLSSFMSFIKMLSRAGLSMELWSNQQDSLA